MLKVRHFRWRKIEVQLVRVPLIRSELFLELFDKNLLDSNINSFERGDQLAVNLNFSKSGRAKRG